MGELGSGSTYGELDYWNWRGVTYLQAVCSQCKCPDVLSYHFKRGIWKNIPKTDIDFFNTITISLSRRFVFSDIKEKLTLGGKFFVIAPRCNPWLWCFCRRYLLHVVRRFHMCWSQQDNCLHQIQF